MKLIPFSFLSIIFIFHVAEAKQSLLGNSRNVFAFSEQQLSARQLCSYCFLDGVFVAGAAPEFSTWLLAQNNVETALEEQSLSEPALEGGLPASDDLKEAGTAGTANGRIEPGIPGTVAEPINEHAELQSFDFDPERDTPLKRYYGVTDENIFWRSEAIFFIAIPFSYLWTSLLKLFTRYFATLGAYFDGARSPELDSLNFLYSHDRYPRELADPFYIFTWVNTIVWPIMVALNDVIQRSSVPEKWERVKTKMRADRFYDDLLYNNY